MLLGLKKSHPLYLKLCYVNLTLKRPAVGFDLTPLMQPNFYGLMVATLMGFHCSLKTAVTFKISVHAPLHTQAFTDCDLSCCQVSSTFEHVGNLQQ